MTGKFLIRDSTEFKKFATLLPNLSEWHRDVFYRLALRREPIVLNVKRDKYIGFMTLCDIPNSIYDDIRNWDKHFKEWRHLV